MVYSAKSASAVTSEFTKRKKIHINSSADGALTDYQIKLTISYETVMQADFDDIRFNEIDGDYINYWLESKTDSSTADVWIKTDVPASGGKDIYMFYGNGVLATNTDGSNTFIQYHGSASANFIDSFNVPPSNVIYETKAKVTAASHNISWGIADTGSYNDDMLGLQTYSPINRRYIYTQNENVSSNLYETPCFTNGTWYKLKITSDGTTVYAYIDDNEIGSGGITTNLPDENLGLFLRITTGSAEQEWSFARKYTANEPTTSIGTEQHQRRIPQFLG